MKRASLVASAVLVALVLLDPRQVAALCCSRDADCPRGFGCDTVTTLDGGTIGDCNPEFVECSCDADCAPGLRCLTGAHTVCRQAADGGQLCALAGECVAPWQAPCSTAADCGNPAFECQANGTICGPSGCAPLTRCVASPLPATCALDTDCPNEWSCEPETAIATLCIPDQHSCPAGGCPPLSATMQCQPPLWDLVGPNSWTGAPPPPSECGTLDASAATSTPLDGGEPPTLGESAEDACDDCAGPLTPIEGGDEGAAVETAEDATGTTAGDATDAFVDVSFVDVSIVNGDSSASGETAGDAGGSSDVGEVAKTGSGKDPVVKTGSGCGCETAVRSGSGRFVGLILLGAGFLRRRGRKRATPGAVLSPGQ